MSCWPQAAGSNLLHTSCPNPASPHSTAHLAHSTAQTQNTRAAEPVRARDGAGRPHASRGGGAELARAPYNDASGARALQHPAPRPTSPHARTHLPFCSHSRTPPFMTDTCVQPLCTSCHAAISDLHRKTGAVGGGVLVVDPCGSSPCAPAATRQPATCAERQARWGEAPSNPLGME